MKSARRKWWRRLFCAPLMTTSTAKLDASSAAFSILWRRGEYQKGIPAFCNRYTFCWRWSV